MSKTPLERHFGELDSFLHSPLNDGPMAQDLVSAFAKFTLGLHTLETQKLPIFLSAFEDKEFCHEDILTLTNALRVDLSLMPTQYPVEGGHDQLRIVDTQKIQDTLKQSSTMLLRIATDRMGQTLPDDTLVALHQCMVDYFSNSSQEDAKNIVISSLQALGFAAKHQEIPSGILESIPKYVCTAFERPAIFLISKAAMGQDLPHQCFGVLSSIADKIMGHDPVYDQPSFTHLLCAGLLKQAECHDPRDITPNMVRFLLSAADGEHGEMPKNDIAPLASSTLNTLLNKPEIVGALDPSSQKEFAIKLIDITDHYLSSGAANSATTATSPDSQKLIALHFVSPLFLKFMPTLLSQGQGEIATKFLEMALKYVDSVQNPVVQNNMSDCCTAVAQYLPDDTGADFGDTLTGAVEALAIGDDHSPHDVGTTGGVEEVD